MLHRVLNKGNSQSIAMLLWSYATLGYRNDDLFINSTNDDLREDDLHKIALDYVLKEGNPQDIANTLWSYATLGYRYEDLFINPNPLCQIALHRVLNKGKSQAIAMLLWSYATLDIIMMIYL